MNLFHHVSGFISFLFTDFVHGHGHGLGHGHGHGLGVVGVGQTFG